MGTDGKKLGCIIRSLFRFAISTCRFFSTRIPKKVLTRKHLLVTVLYHSVEKLQEKGNYGKQRKEKEKKKKAHQTTNLPVQCKHAGFFFF